MAKLMSAFDSNQHDDPTTFEPIPAGEYPMQITKSSLEVTKDKKGKYIKLELTVMNGEFKGRKIWTNLNIVNANPVAVEIANKTLAMICRACNKPQIQDTAELHGIPMTVKVLVKPAKGDYPPQNNPVSFVAAGVQPKKSTKKVAPKKRKPVVEDTDEPGWSEEEED